jgi:hypothetical protein
MEDYQLKWSFAVGSGTVTINGTPYGNSGVITVTEGTSVNVVIVLDSGFTGNSIVLNGATFFAVDPLDFTFTMPFRDSRLLFTSSGNLAPVDGYVLKYFSEYLQNTGTAARCIRLEIYQDGYGGSSSLIEIENVLYYFGNINDDPLRTLIGSKIDFTIAGTIEQFEEFLEGDNRTWKVLLKDDGVLFFTGYVSPDYITTRDKSGKRLQRFTATDGIDSLNTIRVDPFIFPGTTRDKAISAIVGSLNQSFVDFKNVFIACDIFETRMNSVIGLFEQFFTPDNAIWTNGEIAKFSDGNRIENDKLYISEVITRLVNPFLCRVFVYENNWYIIRIPDMKQNSFSGFKYLPTAAVDGSFTITNNLIIDCDINNPERTARKVFTDFEAFLKLGILAYETRGSIWEAQFNSEEWFVMSAVSPYPGRWKLLRWDYINSIPSNQPTSVPSGDTALIQYSTQGGTECVQIWTTTTTSGLSDTNLSFISLSTDSTGRILDVAEELANKISLSFKFMLRAVSSTNPRTEGNHSVAIMLRIGTSYLQRTGTDTFGWTTTPSYCSFACENSYVFNSVSIPSLTVPETGEVEFRFCQLILNAGTRHQYTVCFDDLKIDIEQNEALQLNEISTKSVTDNPYTNIHPKYETWIGDSITNLSTSAIKLTITDSPVSETWSRDGIEAIPLLDSICIELANLKGLANRRILGALERIKPKPYQTVQYKGRYWMVISIVWDTFRDSWQIELFDLGSIPTT